MVILVGETHPALKVWLPAIVEGVPLVTDGFVNAVATTVTGGLVPCPRYRRLMEMSISLEIITHVNLTPSTTLIPWIPGTRLWALAMEIEPTISKGTITAKHIVL
jgi:hypothetical protein